jgi:hypothetical protein
MRVDAEVAGILVAVGFLVMGAVSMPIASGFVAGSIGLGLLMALLLRFTSKRIGRLAVGTTIVLASFALWWLGHTPRRPHSVSSNALYVLPNNVPFTLHKTGYWLECWFDEHERVDRCKLTDESGNKAFEDVFLPCMGRTTLPQSALVFERRTGKEWTQSADKRINAPIVHLDGGQLLLPQSLHEEARQQVYCPDSEFK